MFFKSNCFKKFYHYRPQILLLPGSCHLSLALQEQHQHLCNMRLVDPVWRLLEIYASSFFKCLYNIDIKIYRSKFVFTWLIQPKIYLIGDQRGVENLPLIWPTSWSISSLRSENLLIVLKLIENFSYCSNFILLFQYQNNQYRFYQCTLEHLFLMGQQLEAT